MAQRSKGSLAQHIGRKRPEQVAHQHPCIGKRLSQNVCHLPFLAGAVASRIPDIARRDQNRQDER